jgi:hypothetical protein
LHENEWLLGPHGVGTEQNERQQVEMSIHPSIGPQLFGVVSNNWRGRE